MDQICKVFSQGKRVADKLFVILSFEEVEESVPEGRELAFEVFQVRMGLIPNGHETLIHVQHNCEVFEIWEKCGDLVLVEF